MRTKENTSQNSTFGITASAPWRLRWVKPLPNFCLKVQFLDDTEGEVDMSALIMSQEAGVFAALRDTALFSQVKVEYGAATWPGEIDLAPDAMYHEIKQHGKWIPH